jgi:outer membrane protein TolC
MSKRVVWVGVVVSILLVSMLRASALAQEVEAGVEAPVDSAAAEEHADTGPATPATPTTPDLVVLLRGEGRGLTANAVAQRAVARSPSMDRARQVLAQTRAGADRAVYAFIPELARRAAYTRIPVGGDRLVSEEVDALIGGVTDPAARALWERQAFVVEDRFQVVGTLTFPVSDYFLEIWPRYEAASGFAAAQALTIEGEASRVALAAREAFYQYARARAALMVSEVAVEQATEHVRHVESIARIGNASRADLMAVRARQAASEVTFARAQGGVELAANALRTALELPPDAQLAIGEDLLRELPADVGEREALVARAVRQRPEGRALRRLLSAHGRSVDAAEGSRWPNLVVQGQAELGRPNSRVELETTAPRFSGHVTLALQWSLQETLQGGTRATEARTEVGQVAADLRALEGAIRAQVTESLVSFAASRQALAAARLGVEAAEESQRVRMAELRRGHVLVTALTDASAGLIRAQLDLVNAAIDARVALARLRHAIGEGETR